MEPNELIKEIVAAAALFLSMLLLLSIPATAEEIKQGYNSNDFARVLSTFLDDQNMVNYRGLKDQKDHLDRFNRSLAGIDPEEFADWDEKEKLAFWINAYNSLTFQAIIEHYPIKSSRLTSLIYPKNSIRQIPGVWDKLTFNVLGREMTLNEIEHEVLREEFNEPRIHVALVCAAKGCPSLRREPFRGDRLDEQLDDQSRQFLAHPDKFRIDREKKKVHLSSIFKWFGEDFVDRYGADDTYQGHGKEEGAVLKFISGYLNDQDRKYLEAGDYSIEYTKYDWSLNEQ